MKTLEDLRVHCQAEIANHVATAVAAYNIHVPQPAELPSDDKIDIGMVNMLSDLAETSRLNLPDFIRLVRGQTDDDPRPNKDLFELARPPAPHLQTTWSRWNDVVRHGVVPEWLPQRPKLQPTRPTNHGSLRDHLPNVWRHIRKGQQEGRYLVVRSPLVDQWKEVFISPLGVVAKAGASPPDIRLINDYSFPEGESVNDYTDRSRLPEISYNPPGDIARRIYRLRRDHPYARILMMLGDVAGAFRHVPVHADHAHMFAFIIDEFLVIDLACGFGWCGSPAWYYLPGELINALYEQPANTALSRTSRQGSFRCDDHTCVEIDDGLHCYIANLALRRAMATVLGPSAINEKKFTMWSEQGRALGLDWDTRRGTVTIPHEKIAKAKQCITDMIASGTATKTSALSLLGCLRHISTCCPSARAFYQRLHLAAIALGRAGRRTLPADAVDDLKWFHLILHHSGRFNQVPVEHFARLADPAVNVFMDASNQGLCVLEPALKQFIRIRFTQDEQDSFLADTSANSINVREFRSAVLAALLWGPTWARSSAHTPTHVRFWIDNTSAVSWSQRRASRQPLAQLYNRLLSLAEFNYSLVCTAAHVPGVDNAMADAGSRAWSRLDHHFETWTNLSSGWTQVQVVAPYDDLSRLWDWCCGNMPSLALPPPSITGIGSNGYTSRDS